MTETNPSIPWNGIPPDPTISGAHWLRSELFPSNRPLLSRWDAGSARWTYFGSQARFAAADMAGRAVYIAPCATPDEVAGLKSTTDLIGRRKVWPPQKMPVTAVATIPGWVFVMPQKAGRPFSIAYGVWVELEDAPPSDKPPAP